MRPIVYPVTTFLVILGSWFSTLSRVYWPNICFSIASCLFAEPLELNFGHLSPCNLALWHWAGLYLAILLYLGHSPFLLLSYLIIIELSQPENSFHSSSVLDCINLTSLETIIDYSQLRWHSSTALAVLMSSGVPLPQFYCGLSSVQQLLRSYRGLWLSSLL